MASQLLQGISQDEHERARFRSRRMFQNGMEAMRYTAFSEGNSEGKLEVTLNMKRKGYDAAEIAEITGLSIDQIKELP